MFSLLPLAVFIVIYLSVSIIMGDFYKVPLTVAFLISAVVGVAMLRGRSMAERIKIFSRGAASENMMLMILIFIVAGAFASSAKAMGSIDATVALTQWLLPQQMILAGLFLAACFISISVGTSVGTIVALVPIASGVAASTGISVPMTTAVVVGGAFFGDNLSFISDTTVVATQSQGCRMSDKFKANIRIVLPAAMVITLVYTVMGLNLHTQPITNDIQPLLVLPYIAVLVIAICGVNVLITLTIGCILTGIIGICYGAFDVFGWMQSMNEGVQGMSELIIVTMLAGGLLETVRINGGIDAIIRSITNHISGRRGGEFSIAALVSVVDFCTANNTVAIITVGPIARQIAERFGINPRRAASILDTFSCITQSIIPYGAQLLMAAGLAAINPVDIVPYLYYPMALFVSAVIAILIKSKA